MMMMMRAGLTETDKQVAQILRKRGGDLSRFIVIAVNKADNIARAERAEEFRALVRCSRLMVMLSIE
jgi:predicted GTPase